MLINSVFRVDFEDEYTYGDDVDCTLLKAQLLTFSQMARSNDFQPTSSSDIGEFFQEQPSEELILISEVVKLYKLIAVNPATSASGERSFSMATRLKTWLRARMTAQRFNSLAILHSHKEKTDKIKLNVIANAFVAGSESRLSKFGTFKNTDFERS